MRKALNTWLRDARDRLVLFCTVWLLRTYFVDRSVVYHEPNGSQSYVRIVDVQARNGSIVLRPVYSEWFPDRWLDLRRGYQDSRTRFWHFHEE